MVLCYLSVVSQGRALALSVYGLLQLHRLRVLRVVEAEYRLDDRGQVRWRVAHLEVAQGRGDESLVLCAAPRGSCKL